MDEMGIISGLLQFQTKKRPNPVAYKDTGAEMTNNGNTIQIYFSLLKVTSPVEFKITLDYLQTD
jgi:hypothetical protein